RDCLPGGKRRKVADGCSSLNFADNLEMRGNSVNVCGFYGIAVASRAGKRRNVSVGVDGFGENPAGGIKQREKLPAARAQGFGVLLDQVASGFEGQDQ
ncbi:MAG TPA: hypothetical protein VGR71_09330, partial [Nitrospira sp.]|nr:hypothetical protein [Nitrospira sp.]